MRARVLVRLGIESASVSNSPTDDEARTGPSGERIAIAGLQQNLSPEVKKF